MGCSSSKRVYDGPQFLGPNGKPRYETTQISYLLQDSNFTSAFITFVKDAWRKNSGSLTTCTDMEAIYDNRIRQRALNSIDFLIDSYDFLSIPYSRFQCYRGYEIYEKYMMHGSVKGIGVSENALDDCSNKLFQNHQLQDELNAVGQTSESDITTCTNGDNGVTGTEDEGPADEVIEQVLAVIGGVFDCKHIDVRNLFGAAVNEVTDYLETEVFPDFVFTYPEAVFGTASSRGSKKASSTAVALRNPAGPVDAESEPALDQRVAALLRPKPSDCAQRLTRLILGDPELALFFRSYLQRVDALCYLLAYNELRDINKKLQVAFHCVDLDYRTTSILYFLHKFHDKYISRSSTLIAPSCCREVLLNSFLCHFTRSPSKVNFEAGFDAFEEDIFDAIASNLIDGFLLSREAYDYCTCHCGTVASGEHNVAVPHAKGTRHAFLDLIVAQCKEYAEQCTELSGIITLAHGSPKTWSGEDAGIANVEAATRKPSAVRQGMFSVMELLRCFCRNFQSYESNGMADRGFHNFVRDAGRENYLHFCHAVYMFKNTTFANHLERMTAGKRLCDKFLSLNSPDYLPVPSCIRDVVYWSHASFDTDIMDYAVMWAHNRLTQLYWVFLVLSDSFAATVQSSSREGARTLTEMGVCYTADGSVNDGQMVLLRGGGVVAPTDTCKHSVPSAPRNSLAQYFASPINSATSAGVCPAGMSRRYRRSSVEQQAHRLKRVSVQWMRKTMCTFGKLTVRELINDFDCCSMFKEFLEKDEASHLLTFLLEVEEYRGITVPAFRVVYFRQIYYKYIHRLAVLPLPVSDHARSVIATQLVNLSENKTADDFAGVILHSAFSVAVIEVLNYVELTYMPKFEKSAQFSTIVQLMQSNKAIDGSANGGGRRTSIAVQGNELVTADLANLKTVLQFQSTSRFFKDFCVRSYCAESLYFWLDVENYQSLPGGTDYMNRIALKIYHKYVVEEANLQINIPALLRKGIAEHIVGCASNNAPNRFLFRKAQEEVFHMMKMDSFVMFQKSKEYAAMIKSVKEQ